jgi:hypothetical protein
LDNSERTRFYSIGWLTRQQSVRIAYVNADTNVVISTRSDSLLLSWSLAWGLKRPGTTPGRPHVCGIPIAG